MFLCHSRLQVRNDDLNSSKILKGLSAISLQPDEYSLVTSLIHSTCYFCVRLTDNMMCNLAVELAMASTADIEDGPILNETDVH